LPDFEAKSHPDGDLGQLVQFLFVEKMFSRERDASKAALAHLVALCRRNSLAVIDCQLSSRHLESLGARTIPRGQFQALLAEHAHAPEATLASP
jgi:leucyl/phenylalanyl-tRNA--protein transferase